MRRGSRTSERGEARREALLRAAAEVFLDEGYAASSIDAIIERAGGSKRNIYDEFGGKEGLFSAFIAQSTERVISALAISKVSGKDLPETLTRFGLQLMRGYMSPDLIRIYRLMVTEANQFPEIVQAFYTQGPGQATSKVAEILEGAKARGEIEGLDCNRLAGHFVGMIRDNFHLQVVLGLSAPPTIQEANDIVTSAVDVFLNGVRQSRTPAIKPVRCKI